MNNIISICKGEKIAIFYGCGGSPDTHISFGIVGGGDYRFTKTVTGWTLIESMDGSEYRCIGTSTCMEKFPPTKEWDIDPDMDLVAFARCFIILSVS